MRDFEEDVARTRSVPRFVVPRRTDRLAVAAYRRLLDRVEPPFGNYAVEAMSE